MIQSFFTLSVLSIIILGLAIVLKFTLYNKEMFNYEPQELQDAGKEILDLPNNVLTDDEYKLRLQTVYPYGEKQEVSLPELDGTE